MEASGTRKPLSCWDSACAKLEKEKGDEYKALLGASGIKDLQERHFLNCLDATSRAQQKNDSGQVRLQRFWEAISPFKELSQTAARLDPNRIAPFALGGLYYLLQVLYHPSLLHHDLSGF